MVYTSNKRPGTSIAQKRSHSKERLVLAENAHPFEDPPLRMNNPFGVFRLTI